MTTENRIAGQADRSLDGVPPPEPNLATIDQSSAVAPFDPMGQIGRYYSNWRLETKADKRLVLRCFTEQTPPADGLIGTVIEMSRVLVHPVQIMDEKTGELHNCLRTVIVQSNGELVAFVSQGIIKSLSLISMMEGRGPWSPPLLVKLRQIPVKGAKRMYTLDLIDTDDDAPAQRSTKRGK